MNTKSRKKFGYPASIILVLLFFLFIITKNKITIAPTTSLQPSPASSPRQLVKLSFVIDGDTIIVNGKTKIRYIGINTPELKTNTASDECFAEEATTENKKLLENKPIIIEKDVSETDKYGRLLRYVWAGDIFINDYLIKNGFARIETIPPDTKYYQQFKQDEQNAKKNRLGLWKSCPSSKY